MSGLLQRQRGDSGRVSAARGVQRAVVRLSSFCGTAPRNNSKNDSHYIWSVRYALQLGVELTRLVSLIELYSLFVSGVTFSDYAPNC